jgi:hypothetical protein
MRCLGDDITGLIIGSCPWGVAPRNSPMATGHGKPPHIRASAPAFPRFNTHSDLPRPPQTPAASFKRLYRE